MSAHGAASARPGAVLVATETNALLRDAVAALPLHERLPVNLHYLEGFSTEDVAKVLQRPVKTVRSQLSRGLQRLRQHMTVRGLALPLSAFPGALAALSHDSAPATLQQATASQWAAAMPATLGKTIASSSVAGSSAISAPLSGWVAAALLLLSLTVASLVASNTRIKPAPVELAPGPATQPVLTNLLDRQLSLHVVEQSVAKIAREIALHVGPAFRWGYPSSAALTQRYVTLDTRDDPQSVRSILDQACAAAGLNWHVHDSMVLFTVPVDSGDNSSTEAKAGQTRWQDDSAPMATRLRAARAEAEAGEAAAMTWLLQEFRRQEPAQLSTQSLSRLRRFIALPSLGATGLSSPFATIGDQPGECGDYHRNPRR